MITIKLSDERRDEAISEAIAALQRGGIIAYPTETFYGLGVKFDMPESLEVLYGLKKRPSEKAMPLIIGRRELLPEVAAGKWLRDVPRAAECLMDRFWPGPLTLLLPAGEGLSVFLTAGTGMIAVRIPGESFALHLAKKAGFPITATSANLSGMPPAMDAEMVVRYFGERPDLLIDGGRTGSGRPSTIVDVSGGGTRILREGAIRRGDIEDCLAKAKRSEGAE